MNIFLTGYCGNLGTSVAKSLSDSDHDLKVLLHGTAIRPNTLPTNIELVWGSLLHSDLMSEITKGVDVVIHSAWDGRGNESQLIETNLKGTLTLLKSSIENNVRKFIYISSVGVYGLEQALWGTVIDEDQPYVSKENAMDPYPWVKILIEKECKKIISESGKDIEFSIIRPGLLYSEQKAPAKKFNDAKNRAIVFGKGRNHLPFIHVDDVAELIKLSIQNDGGGIYNCVPSEFFSARDFVRKWGRYYNKGALRVIYFPPWFVRVMGKGVKVLKEKLGKPALGDIDYPIMTGIRDVRYSNQKAFKELGWTDKTTQAIAKT